MKRILVIATGGTIASLPAGTGLAPALTGEELIRRVPAAAEIASIDVVQPMNIDSCDMAPAGWLELASIIEGSYDAYDGFVILHGTDTLGYTAAGLSYLVQGSEKPIALTGSQQPMASSLTDAALNLQRSLIWAADDASRDVAVVFDDLVIAGTRAHKQRTLSFAAFESMNYPPIAHLRGSRIVRSAATAEAPPAGPPRFYHALDEHVCVVKLTPGLDPAMIDALAPYAHAIVLETFGVGGIPSAGGGAWERRLFAWVESGRTLVMTTQVPEEGLDMGVYAVGRAFAEHPGILMGDDMTLEALVAKTMWARGCTTDADEIARLFAAPVNRDRAVG